LATLRPSAQSAPRYCHRAAAWGLALLAALALTSAGAQTVAIADQARAIILEGSLSNLRRQFEVPADLPLAPEFRAAAIDLAAAHVQRMKFVVERWIAEEVADGGVELHPVALHRRVEARLLNEFAVWHLVSVDRWHQERMLSLALEPQACHVSGQVDPFALRLELLNRLPTDQQGRALELERRLLAAWGEPNRQLPQRPVPSVDDALRSAIDALRAGTGQFDIALPPGAAQQIHVSTSVRLEQMPDWNACLLRQWWLRTRLQAAGADRGQIDLARRYDQAPQASSWFADPPSTTRPNAAKSAAPEYPPFATRFEVEGKVEVEVTLDADGRPQRATVVKRLITVPGIRDVPPVAFDLVFDEFSVARALKTSFAKPDPVLAKAGHALARVELVWKLR
jgi:Gram-negative bacterial TonB protein C-terminal